MDIFPSARIMPTMKKRATDNGDRLRAALQRFMDSRGLTIGKWATVAGISPYSLRRLFKGDGDTLTHSTLQKLAAPFGVSVETITGQAAPRAGTMTPAEPASVERPMLQEVIAELEKVLAQMGGTMEPELKGLTVWVLYQMAQRGPVSAAEYENVIKLALYR